MEHTAVTKLGIPTQVGGKPVSYFTSLALMGIWPRDYQEQILNYLPTWDLNTGPQD